MGRDLPTAYLDALATGGNPFAASQSYWESVVWIKPSAGFKVRVCILAVLLGWMCVASLSNIILMAISASRRGERLWAVRLVKRENGRYIVLPHILLTSVSPLLYSVPLIATLWTAWDVYYSHRSSVSLDVMRLLTWIIFFLTGWLLTCGSMQAYSLAGGDRRLHLTPNRLNTLFLSILVIVSAGLLTSFGRGIQISVDKESRLRALLSFTAEQAPRWNGTADPDSFNELQGLATAFNEAHRDFEREWTSLVAIYLGVTLFILLMNIGTFAIVFMIRRQIDESIDMLDIGNTIVSQQQLQAPPNTQLTPDSPSPGLRTPSSPARGPTTSQLEKTVGAHSNVIEQEQAKRIKKLKMAEMGLKISCITISVFITTVIIQTLFTIITFRNANRVSWGEMEASLTMPGWVCAVLFGYSQSMRCVANYRSLRPRDGEVLPSTRNSADSGVLDPATVVDLPLALGGGDIEIVVEDSEGTVTSTDRRTEEDQVDQK